MAEDSDEMESFDVNDEDLKRAYNPNYKKKRMSKASAMLGIWAESDDDDDNNDNDESNGRRNREKQSKSSTISFVSSANEKQTKTTPKQQPDEEADDSNSDASSDEEEKISTRHTDKIILENLDEIEKEVKEKKAFVRKHNLFSNNKTQQQQQPSQSKRSSFSNVTVNKKAQQEIGNWEKVS